MTPSLSTVFGESHVLCSRPKSVRGLDKMVPYMHSGFCSLPDPGHLLLRFPTTVTTPHPSPSPHPLTRFSPHRLYLGNPMDPPDLLSVELSTSRPTQHLGRVKSKSLAPQCPLVHQLPRKRHCLVQAL